MMKRKIFSASVLFVSGIFMFLLSGVVSEAHTDDLAEREDIVLVLDCSKSMEEVDGEYMAFDFVKGFANMVPDQYRIGVVGYNQEICIQLPPGSSRGEIELALQDITYGNYGNAGAGLLEAVSCLKDSRNGKKIIMISDGENLMNSEDATAKSIQLFETALTEAKKLNISIDIINLGTGTEDGADIYAAADSTGGTIYHLENGRAFEEFAGHYLFDIMEIPCRSVGKIDGADGELTVRLPDCMMTKAKIILTGRQQNDNLTINCEADEIQVFKGIGYTVIELENPVTEDIIIRMDSEINMEIDAYLTAGYDFKAEAEYTYLSDSQQVEIEISLKNEDGRNLLLGHVVNDGLAVLLNGDECGYELRDGKLVLYKQALQDQRVELELQFQDTFGIYYGNRNIELEIQLPEMEEKTETDWFFRGVIFIFSAVLILVFCMAGKRKNRLAVPGKIVDDSRTYPEESGMRTSGFWGKLLVYVIHSRDDIDYPPESINLFTGCSREVITLEWIIDTCSLPLELKGAEKIIIKPGDDRSLIIKNNGPAAVMKGRELLIKGRSYHLYYHEKVTFIFDQEDTEIEVHYKDLKPNEK